MFGDLDWPLNASCGFVSISWASCYYLVLSLRYIFSCCLTQWPYKAVNIFSLNWLYMCTMKSFWQWLATGGARRSRSKYTVFILYRVVPAVPIVMIVDFSEYFKVFLSCSMVICHCSTGCFSHLAIRRCLHFCQLLALNANFVIYVCDLHVFVYYILSVRSHS